MPVQDSQLGQCSHYDEQPKFDRYPPFPDEAEMRAVKKLSVF